MSTVIDQNPRQPAVQSMKSIVGSTAANDDHLPSAARPTRDASESGGWNAHDVWRRLIKEVRDRRDATGRLQQ
jgi:hypothetical protein